MHCFEEMREIACAVETMFDVVMDIDRYAEFLPWVAASRVLACGEDELTAELVAELAGSRHAFRTVDRFIRPKIVEIRLLDGPFRFLESVWSFEALGERACRVHFSIEFQFRSMMLDLVASPVFSAACRTMVQAFERRALALEAQG